MCASYVSPPVDASLVARADLSLPGASHVAPSAIRGIFDISRLFYYYELFHPYIYTASLHGVGLHATTFARRRAPAAPFYGTDAPRRLPGASQNTGAAAHPGTPAPARSG